MDEQALAQIQALREKWADVSTLKQKWEESKVYCVAPKDVRIPLHLLAVAVRTAPTLEEAQRYAQKITDILEWMWPRNTRQRFNAVQIGTNVVEVPQPR
jgi:hypothetical protein